MHEIGGCATFCGSSRRRHSTRRALCEARAVRGELVKRPFRNSAMPFVNGPPLRAPLPRSVEGEHLQHVARNAARIKHVVRFGEGSHIGRSRDAIARGQKPLGSCRRTISRVLSSPELHGACYVENEIHGADCSRQNRRLCWGFAKLEPLSEPCWRRVGTASASGVCSRVPLESRKEGPSAWRGGSGWMLLMHRCDASASTISRACYSATWPQGVTNGKGCDVHDRVPPLDCQRVYRRCP